MLLQLKTLLRELVLPPTSLLLLGLLGLALWHRRPRLSRALLALVVAGLWLLSTPWLSQRLVMAAQRYPALDLRNAAQFPAPAQAPARAPAQPPQAIVILGGGGQRAWAPEYRGPAAGGTLLERLSYGAWLARQTGLPVLVSGYQIEAVAMRVTLERNFNITPRWYDDMAYDTFQNARDSARLLRADGIQRVLLVSHATHLWRAAHEFMSAGLQVIPAPVDVRTASDAPSGPLALLPDADALRRSHVAIYELLGEQVRMVLAFTHVRRH